MPISRSDRAESAIGTELLVAKAPTNHRTGLKSMISGPFFIGNLVGVGCRIMVVGPRLGTLAGTLQPTPMCAVWAHVDGRVASGRSGSCRLQCIALQLQCNTHWRTLSWMIRSPSVCLHRWVAASGERPVAWGAGLRTSSAWRSRHFFREHRRPTVNRRNAWSTSSARCLRESPTWRSDIVSTFSRR